MKNFITTQMTINNSALDQIVIFKIRFNTNYGDTDLYWRVIVDDTEYLVRNIICNVPTHSESSFDSRANAQKWHIAGVCSAFTISEEKIAHFD